MNIVKLCTNIVKLCTLMHRTNRKDAMKNSSRRHNEGFDNARVKPSTNASSIKPSTNASSTKPTHTEVKLKRPKKSADEGQPRRPDFWIETSAGESARLGPARMCKVVRVSRKSGERARERSRASLGMASLFLGATGLGAGRAATKVVKLWVSRSSCITGIGLLILGRGFSTGRVTSLDKSRLTGRATGLGKSRLTGRATGLGKNYLTGQVTGLGKNCLTGRVTGLDKNCLTGQVAGLDKNCLTG
ncbi:hypothetical protein B296_00018605 [Ensete ventricosum]|uniref:Uncharacterized protein n=1 Tax=Ensete ventricosum TaxID=4639 RepID=A0A427A219_ENSVE|nr:hypothetical protein B296_00018605 [Ensete ventricosum]